MARARTSAKKTSGDVIRINVTPYKGLKTQTFPWVRIFKHPYGIRHAAATGATEEGPSKDETRQEFALRLGMRVIQKSKILTKWFK